MGSKRKRPSFDIPDTVRRAGQAGWVYRTDSRKPEAVTKTAAHATPKPKAPDRVAPAVAVVPVAPVVPAVTPRAPVTRETAVPETAPRAGSTVSGMGAGLIGFSLQVAAVPLIVPLYLAAALSRKLGLHGR